MKTLLIFILIFISTISHAETITWDINQDATYYNKCVSTVVKKVNGVKVTFTTTTVTGGN